MDDIQLGTTDLRVSRLCVGTAAFGLDRYGITAPGEGSVDPAEGIANIDRAVEGGINFFDTSPAYGRSEELLGEALADHKDCLVATKVPIPENLDRISQSELTQRVNESLAKSLRRLRREVPMSFRFTMQPFTSSSKAKWFPVWNGDATIVPQGTSACYQYSVTHSINGSVAHLDPKVIVSNVLVHHKRKESTGDAVKK